MTMMGMSFSLVVVFMFSGTIIMFNGTVAVHSQAGGFRMMVMRNEIVTQEN